MEVAANSATGGKAPADRRARFWDRIAERYARRPVSDEASYRKKLEITRAYLTLEAEVLEIGCGTGSTALEHAPYAKRIRAVDISAKMIEIARAKASDARVGNVSFEQAALEDLAVADESVDMVMGHSLLHLLEDRDASLARIFRMLKPGGVFVASTACIRDMAPALRFVAAPLAWLGLIPMVRVFTAAELEASIRAAGFELERSWSPGKNKALFTVARKPARG